MEIAPLTKCDTTLASAKFALYKDLSALKYVITQDLCKCQPEALWVLILCIKLYSTNLKTCIPRKINLKGTGRAATTPYCTSAVRYSDQSLICSQLS